LDLPSWGDWHSRLQQKGPAYSKELNSLSTSASKPIHPLRLVSEIEVLRRDDSYLVLDGANSILWALMALQVKAQGGTILSTMGELQAIGAGVPQAIAIKRARPDHQVILHTGDGSLGYGLMEFETALRYDIPIVVVVHNDSGWGMTRDMQVEYFGKRREIGNRLGTVRYDQMIAAMGGYGELVEQPDDIQAAIQRALESGLPACVNVMVDPEPKSPGLITFFIMEVMLGKQTYYDKLPDWIRKLGNWGLETPVTKAILRYLDRRLHQQID
jgi:acetolactate synthase-1/2/3 large subunit